MEDRLKLVYFGIEFETCVCGMEGDIENGEQYFLKLQKIADDNNVNFKAQHQLNPRIGIDYTKWSVTYDGSVRCDLGDGKFFIGGNRIPKSICKYFKIPIEVVTPIYNYRNDYSLFNTILDDVFISTDFQYESNQTQGMHINISYTGRDNNPLKTLEMWWYFEPVIIYMVPPERRCSIFTVQLRDIFKTIEDLRENAFEFYSMPDAAPAKYTMLCKKSNRFEFRLVNARMEKSHIKSWLGFCARFISSSVAFIFPDNNTTGTFDELFQYIDQPYLKKYFQSQINYFKNSYIGIDVAIRSELELPLRAREFNYQKSGLVKVGSLFHFSELQSINLSDNELESLPENTCDLENLEIIELNRNKILSLPESIGNLVNLKILKLNTNKIVSLPESIGNLVNLKILELIGNKIELLPESIGNLVNLETLNLTDNKIEMISESIGKLVNLKILGLGMNKITYIPESIGNLSNLEELDLDRNEIESVPEIIGNISNLKILGLSMNKITHIPESIGNLSNLEILALSYNNLSSVPESIADITTISELDLRRNRFDTLPERIVNIQGVMY